MPVNRRNQILAAVLALQLIVVAVVFWPRPTASGGAGESLLPGVEADRIVELRIRDGQGKTIQLAKRSGGDWVLPDADDYPCQADKDTPLIAKIVGLKADRLVTQTSGSTRRLLNQPQAATR